MRVEAAPQYDLRQPIVVENSFRLAIICSWPSMRQPSRLPRSSARRRVRAAACGRALPFLGPAFVAAIAYVDPGNFATNIAGGAKFGYLLLWVILAANLMAMLIQFLSAKVGIATGRSLPELCREHFPRQRVGRPVDPGRGDRDGDRPGGVRRRRDRAQPAVRAAAAARRPRDRRGRVRAARAADARLPALRDRHRRHARRDPARLPGRRAAGAARRRRHRERLHPRLRGHRLAAARHRHPRRDRDAARDLPALGADPAARRRRATTAGG